MKLYHYTTLDAFAKIWVAKQLRFSKSAITNDFFEKRKGYDLPIRTLDLGAFLEKARIFDEIYSRILDSYVQLSFTKSYSKNGFYKDGYISPMMWGHYARNENGVCIEIDKEKIPKIPSMVKMRSVIYTEHVPLLTPDLLNLTITEDTIEQLISSHLKELFFVKHKHWKFENEYRMIIKSNQETFLPLGNAISAVYVYNVQDINTAIVEQLVQQQVPIYALTTNTYRGYRQIDCFEMAQYYKAMKKERPKLPKLKIQI